MMTKSRAVWIVLGCLVCGVASASTVEERLQMLEAGYERLLQENAALRQRLDAYAPAHAPAAIEGQQPAPALAASPPATPPAAAPGATVAKSTVSLPAAPSVFPGGKETKLTVGGFIQGQAEGGDAGDQRWVGVNDRFFLRRARIYLAGSFAEHFDFKIEGDFSSNSLSAGTGLKATANEVFVNWNKYPLANLRFGQLKPAFGGEQLQSDTTMYTIERYLGSDRLADGRQPGIGLYGNDPNKRFGYVVTLGNGNGSNSSANDNDSFQKAARFFGTVAESDSFGKLTAGVNVMESTDNGVSKPGYGFDSVPGSTADNLFIGDRRGYGADAVWKRGPFDLAGEFTRVRYEPVNVLPSSRINADGWHLTAAYVVVPNRLQAVLRRESFDPNTDVSGDSTDNWVAGLNYLAKGDDIKFSVNYLFGDAPGLPDDHGRVIARLQILY